MTQRWKIIVEYEGTHYCGWQMQDIPQPSVQETIEKAIEKFSQQQVRLHVAGRTDSGVHAYGQIAHFDFVNKHNMGGYDLCKAINAHLRPHPIALLHAEQVDDNFHARYSAKNKLYIYRIVTRSAPLTTDAGRAWHMHRTLDSAAMHEAAQILRGTHDFTTFRASECQAKSPIRDISDIKVIEKPYDDYGGQDIRIYVEGQAFLHHMVRNIAGSLAYVGLGKWSNETLKNALEACDRTQGGPTAPPDGLYLARIDYK